MRFLKEALPMIEHHAADRDAVHPFFARSTSLERPLKRASFPKEHDNAEGDWRGGCDISRHNAQEGSSPCQ